MATLAANIALTGDVQPEVLGFDFIGTGGGSDANTDPSLYDVLGRRFFLSARYRF